MLESLQSVAACKPWQVSGLQETLDKQTIEHSALQGLRQLRVGVALTEPCAHGTKVQIGRGKNRPNSYVHQEAGSQYALVCK